MRAREGDETPRFRLTADANLGKLRGAAPGGGFFELYFPFKPWQKVVAGLCVASLPVLFFFGGINDSVLGPDRPGEAAALVALVLLLSIMLVKVIEMAFLPRPHREPGEPWTAVGARRRGLHTRFTDLALLLLVAACVSFGIAVATGFSFR